MVKAVQEYLDQNNKRYQDRKRLPESGPARVGKRLHLRQDVYSVAFVYQLRRVWAENALSEDELENSA